MAPTILKTMALLLLLAVYGTGSPRPSTAPGQEVQTSVAPASAAAGSGGNLMVVVPPVPPRPALHRLCRRFLSGPWHGGLPGSVDRRDSTLIRELISATGGTTTATTAWCNSYLGG
jgi:hypothetical protein